MGGVSIVEIGRRLAAGQAVKALRDLRGVAYVLGASETPPPDRRELWHAKLSAREFEILPSFEAVKADKPTFAEATRLIHINTNPFNTKHLAPFNGGQAGCLK